MHYDIFSGMMLFPLLGILILIAWRRLDEEGAFRVALAAGLAPWAFLARILPLHRPAPAGVQLAYRADWLPACLGDLHTGLDGFNLGLLVAGALVLPLAI